MSDTLKEREQEITRDDSTVNSADNTTSSTINDIVSFISNISADIATNIQEKFINFNVTKFDSIDSTGAYAKRQFERGDITEGTVIFAEHQSKGYGRYGKEWISPKGNFYCSIVLKPNTDLRRLSQLPFVFAAAVGRVLKDLLPEDRDKVQYKWPNDILINNKKVAGILLESSMTRGSTSPNWLLVGIGINTVNSPNVKLPFPCSSLIEEDADPTTESKILNNIL
ncbi:MAG: biotin--[acetyl-CoA-carboxylase] ligase [Pseudomonadota bacterium]